MNVQQLENELWEAADQLRANSKLTAAEYAMPVLGLIFLRHADNRFKAYSMFTAEFRAFEKVLSVTMRVPRRAGEKLYCDFAGRKVPITDKETGEIRLAQVFVCTMGASSKMYAQGVWTQKEADWIDCHIKAFEP
jgi:transposase